MKRLLGIYSVVCIPRVKIRSVDPRGDSMKIGKFLPTPVKRLAWTSLHRVRELNTSYRKTFTESVRRDYSQAGETIAVRKITRRRYGGLFVEIGANDGISLSTTYGLLKDGWQGWSIEANPITYKKLVANLAAYPKAKTLNVAVAPCTGKVQLFLGKDDPEGFYATLSDEDSSWFRDHRSQTAIEVDGLTLADLLIAENVPMRFDLLLVDTEGMDLEILRTFDPQKHRPYLIVTEDYQPKNQAKFELLESFGYQFDRRIGCNTFWIDRR